MRPCRYALRLLAPAGERAARAAWARVRAPSPSSLGATACSIALLECAQKLERVGPAEKQTAPYSAAALATRPAEVRLSQGSCPLTMSPQPEMRAVHMSTACHSAKIALRVFKASYTAQAVGATVQTLSCTATATSHASCVGPSATLIVGQSRAGPFPQATRCARLTAAICCPGAVASCGMARRPTASCSSKAWVGRGNRSQACVESP